MRGKAERRAGRMGEVAGADRLTDLEQLFEVGVGSVSVDHAAEHSFEPGAAFTAGRALPTALVGVEAHERQRCRRDVGGVVHHHDRPGAEHRPCGADELALERQVELLGREPRRRTATGHERLELVAVADALAELVAVQQIAERGGAVDDLEHAGAVHVPTDGNHAGAGARDGADGRVRLDAVVHQPRQVRQRLDVVHDRGLAVEADGRREVRGLESRLAALALEALDERRLLADHIGTRTPVQHDVDTEVRAEDVPSDVAGGVRIVERQRHSLVRQGHLATNVEETLRQPCGVARDQAALDELVWISLEEQAVLVRAGFALVTVDDQVPGELARRHETPLGSGREPGAAAAEHRGTSNLVVDFRGRLGQRLLQAVVPAGGEVPIEGVAVFVGES